MKKFKEKTKKEELINKVKETIISKKMIDNNDRIVVGLSGGPDSVCLFDILIHLKPILEKEYNISYELIICHINHMIREEAIEDINLAREYSEKNNIPFFLLERDIAQIAKENKISEEECGRNIRYEFFNKVLKESNANKITVAHNKEDNAETVLHNIIRGTGLSGLCGIKYINGNIIRPLLNISKKEILEYLKENDIKYNLDITNQTNDYTRNKIRNNLIKNIEKEYNPNFINAITKMSETLNVEKEYIDSMTRKVYEEIIIQKENDKIIMDISKFKLFKEAIKNRLIILCIEEVLGTTKGIEKIYIDDIKLLLENSITNKKYLLSNKLQVLISKKNRVEFKKI
ncbi:MAG: tRNA lysidine(34) synthetase TilS [Clostridia bacterium]|nr:tRNA lysidine(34) synthetase TilS [Clostridia bacterium]MDD4375194.1 tRNA lysidine(34) synthetase TilS [Clostridia bacterium]